MSETQANPTLSVDAIPDHENKATNSSKRKKSFKLFAIILIVIGLLYFGWQWLHAGEVETDNAYVGADTAQVTSMLNAQITEVLVQDTQQVHQGDILVKLDERDAQLAIAQATAQLAKVQRQFQQSQANNQALNSQILVSSDTVMTAKAQLQKAQADYEKSLDDFKRRQQLVNIGAVSKEELSRANTSVNTAKANVAAAQAELAQAESGRKAAQSNLAANDALIKGSNESNTPDALVAKANLEQAQLNLERTVIRAPIDGIVTNRNVQIGQRIAAGTSVMKIVPVQQLYVDANFKEGQLAKVKVGQEATLTSDFYGKNVIFHGKVIGLAGGTGAAFALIPAQNATGNWIKVVQRLPVRIALDPKELHEHPLRVGLSMNAVININTKS